MLEVPLTIDYSISTHLFCFSIRSLTRLLEDNNFTIIKDFRYLDKLYQHDNLAIMAKNAARVYHNTGSCARGETIIFCKVLFPITNCN